MIVPVPEPGSVQIRPDSNAAMVEVLIIIEFPWLKDSRVGHSVQHWGILPKLFCHEMEFQNRNPLFPKQSCSGFIMVTKLFMDIVRIHRFGDYLNFTGCDIVKAAGDGDTTFVDKFLDCFALQGDFPTDSQHILF